MSMIFTDIQKKDSAQRAKQRLSAYKEQEEKLRKEKSQKADKNNK